jgi:tetratricopeptide (TPR) repeat protein
MMTTLSSDKPSDRQRSTTSRFLKWLFSWPSARQVLIDFAVLVTLIALFYAEEDWRGWHAWQKFKHEWEARGERFDRASVVPSPVSDDQNFALTPIVASSYLHVLDKTGHQIRPTLTNVVNRLRMEIAHNNQWPTNAFGDWQKSTVSDLKVWQQYYRAQAAKTNEFPVPAQPQSPAADVLLALTKYDPAIEELRQATKLPYSRFPLEYDKEDTAAILLPHLNALVGCARVLLLRAIAELQNGQSDKALDDVKLTLRLTDSVRTEPFLISHLVRIAILGITMQPVWEGLAEQKWSDAQLVELDRELAELDFLVGYKLAMRGELVLEQGGMIDYLRHHPEQLLNMMSREFDSEPARICRLIPRGWFYQNQLRSARAMVELYLPVADVSQGIISPTATRRAYAALEADTKHPNPYNIIERMFVPGLGGAVRRFAYGQSSLDLARVVIALERYRLAHGEYPESLDALAPQFIAKLPHDIINGQPLHYRRTNDGQFVLYSVGWNETDDGGVVALRTGGSIDFEKGDWVWQYPAQ